MNTAYVIVKMKRLVTYGGLVITLITDYLYSRDL